MRLRNSTCTYTQVQCNILQQCVLVAYEEIIEGVPILPSSSSIGGGEGTKFGGPLSLLGLGGTADSPVIIGGNGALRLGRIEARGEFKVAVTTSDVVRETLLSDSVGEEAGRMRGVTASSNLVDLFTRLLPHSLMKSHDIALMSGA